MNLARYQRQSLLPSIGGAGQKRLHDARVLIVGCGALGSAVADQLCRAGIGWLRIVDRDVVELTNLQRQTLYDERDVDQPKAIAAAGRLSRINSDIHVEPIVGDANGETIADLIRIDDGTADLIIDGSDNIETRWLLNDMSVQRDIPWIYGGCVAAEGRCMIIRPQRTPCLRCIFPDSQIGVDAATCDTAGILGPAAMVVASLQSAAAIQLLRADADAADSVSLLRGMVRFDLWTGRWQRSFADAGPDPNCPVCAGRQFDSLQPERDALHTPRVLCGRNAVQFRASIRQPIDLHALADRWAGGGETRRTPMLLRYRPSADGPIELSVFEDGRVIIHGCRDVDRAQRLYDRYLG